MLTLSAVAAMHGQLFVLRIDIVFDLLNDRLIHVSSLDRYLISVFLCFLLLLLPSLPTPSSSSLSLPPPPSLSSFLHLPSSSPFLNLSKVVPDSRDSLKNLLPGH